MDQDLDQGAISRSAPPLDWPHGVPNVTIGGLTAWRAVLVLFGVLLSASSATTMRPVYLLFLLFLHQTGGLKLAPVPCHRRGRFEGRRRRSVRMVATPVAPTNVVGEGVVVGYTGSGDITISTIRQCDDEFMAAACVRSSAFSPDDVMANGWKFKKKRDKVFEQMKARYLKGATFLVAVAHDEVMGERPRPVEAKSTPSTTGSEDGTSLVSAFTTWTNNLMTKSQKEPEEQIADLTRVRVGADDSECNGVMLGMVVS